MVRYVIVVARTRPDLFEEFRERYSDVFEVILDRRQAPRPETATPWLAPPTFERDGYVIGRAA